MNEEIRNHKAELNEAELENVSGGMSSELAWQIAESNCAICNRKIPCGPRIQDLKTYIQMTGANVTTWTECPFYEEAGRM